MHYIVHMSIYMSIDGNFAYVLYTMSYRLVSKLHTGRNYLTFCDHFVNLPNPLKLKDYTCTCILTWPHFIMYVKPLQLYLGLTPPLDRLACK